MLFSNISLGQVTPSNPTAGFKPCPICKEHGPMELLTSTANIDRPYQIYCRKCTLSIFGATIDELRAKWNALTPDTSPVEAATTVACAMIDLYGAMRDTLLEDEAPRTTMRAMCADFDRHIKDALAPKTPNTNAPGQ